MPRIFPRLFAKHAALHPELPHTDIHSHLLPGLDDGSKSMAESMALVRSLKERGFTKCITTPHIMPDLFPNTETGIREALPALQKALRESEIDMEVEAAAEYYVDELFAERMQTEEPFLTFGNGYWLFEFPVTAKPKNADTILFEMQLKQYKPVLAHPERYPWLAGDRLEKYASLKDADVLFQVNILSFGGAYGAGPKRAARMLADAGMINFAGSDLHNTRQLAYFDKALQDRSFIKLLESGSLMNHNL